MFPQVNTVAERVRETRPKKTTTGLRPARCGKTKKNPNPLKVEVLILCSSPFTLAETREVSVVNQSDK